MGCYRLLLFSLSIGAGHDSAARSIEDAGRERGIEDIQIKDFFVLASPRVGKLITKSYFLSLKKVPYLYSKAYTWSEGDTPRQLRPVRKFFSRSAREKVAEFLEEFQPDGVVCTHPFPLAVLSDLKLKGRLTMPVTAVVTDYTVHPLWVQPGVDRFYVGSPETGEELRQKGISPEKIRISGIPVAKKFSRRLDKDVCKNNLGFPTDRPLIMLMGGGLGFGPLDKIVKNLDKLDIPVTIAVITGNNKELYDSLGEMEKYSRQDLRRYKFIENVDEFMSAADLLITKPGGLTIAEALCKQLPMIIVDPLPGHEERNAFFLRRAGLALVVEKENNGWVESLSQLFHSDLLAGMRERAAAYACPGAAGFIIDDIEGMLL